MKRSTLALCLTAAAFWLASAARSQEAEEAAAEPPAGVVLPDTWYSQALASSTIGINVTHFWSRGPLLRAETVIGGHRVVTIVKGDTYYAYDGLTRLGIAVGRAPLAMEQDQQRARPFGNEVDAILRQGGELVGTEELGGRSVRIYRVTDPAGKRQVWATDDEASLPLRLEIYRRPTKQTVRTDFLNWQRGLLIELAFFEPEAGVTLSRLSYDEYMAKQSEGETVGPVPVLYADLLHGIAPE